jgi:16S rRNA (guanine1516-N2)-methyltransferase
LLSIPLLDTGIRARDEQPGSALLLVQGNVAAVQLTGRDAPGAVSIDFADKTLANRRRAGHNELLGKAIGWKQAHAPRVLDMTGGFGRDAFLLADLGCTLRVCERDPVMALLLDDALQRAAASQDPWLSSVCARIHLFDGDARTLDAKALSGIEVIYLDPMFPLERRAAPGKEMQVLHQLLAGTAGDDNGDLLAWARAQAVSRVVVKRPRRAPRLPGPVPGHSLTGRSVRFDVYPLSQVTDASLAAT